MDLKDLLHDSSRRTAELGVRFIGNDPDRFLLMLNFAMEDVKPFAMRAARVINMTAKIHPDFIRAHLPGLIQKLHEFKTDGLKRGVLKTLAERSLDYDEDTLGKLVDTCFLWINDPSEKIAIKIYALDILYSSSYSYPEIIPELIASIEHIMPFSSSGVKSKGKKLLKKLYKRQK